ncbi:bifunctional sugar phosphate isomerase/epimerase/4-hydroxyphenylpyruvate dioxygenase family protein [Lacibacterium aquatile]|uniref:3-dehydroshikimate dehydratase n=1 Tax=Lacibacterium aquatile TaxID=1168082 RepID=A0ABW5DN05_9PROT
MKTSIATVSISGDLQEKIAAIAAAGYAGVEIFEQDFLTFDGSPQDIGRMARDHGLEITVFQPFRDFEGMPDSHRARTFDRAERKFDLMQQLGTDLMLICSSISPLALGGIDRAAADFNELGERAAKRGLRVGYEALAWGRFVNDHRDAWEIVRRADHPNIGLILDSFHTLSRKISPQSIRAIPGDRIFLVQLADAPLIEMDLLQWSRHLRMMPGQGDLPVTDFMRAVVATGYDGPWSLEIFNDQFRGGSPKSIAVDGYRSLLFLGEQVKEEEPALPVPMPPLPPRTEVEGVEFVEFATSEKEAKDLVALVEALGFQRAGRHRTKDVTLYRQGGINLLINTARDGFAHSSFALHGTSAYAIALKVTDAAATVERARLLGAMPFEQPSNPGEAKLPAIRGVGGGIIYLLDASADLGAIWEKDFALEATAVTGAGLGRIDHIAQTMNYEEMLTWILFYRSLVKAQKTPMVDIVDPAGLIRSQVIESPDGALRLTLNGAENRNTLAGHFISESFGSSIQHVAFSTDDIFATATALKTAGFKPLTVSANYYADLDARYQLGDALIARMQGLGILYDRDDAGEFFHLYSQTFGEGFFFEICERRSGYRGYGAPNAPFRIAAQKRQMHLKEGLNLL